jgi:hypothetical protein
MAKRIVSYGGQQVNIGDGRTYVNGRLVTGAELTGISFDAATGTGTVSFADGTVITSTDPDDED